MKLNCCTSLLLLVLSAGLAVAEPVKPASGHPSFEELLKLRAADPSALEKDEKELTPCSAWESSVREECLKAYAQYFQYEANVFTQRRRDFDFQLFSTKVILWMVVILVLAGVTFAGLQFWYALFKLPTHRVAQAGAALNAAVGVSATSGETAARIPPDSISAGDFSSDIEVSMTGFKVKSSVLGLLLVLISMGFFFLYIRYVYPIVDGPQPSATVSATPQK